MWNARALADGVPDTAHLARVGYDAATATHSSC